MKFNYLSLLGVALMGLQQSVFAKTGTASDKESNPVVLSSDSNTQQPYCYTVPNGVSYGGSDTTNPTRNWLHQWVGTYYNGTIVCYLFLLPCILSGMGRC